MARKFSEKARGRGLKPQKPIILMVAEGHNMTESLCFRQFQKQHADYNIKILIPGSTTDPEGMLKKLERFWKTNEMDLMKGDRGFVVLDLDCDDSKGRLIEKLDQGSKIAQFVISNPCFEVWFLLHYRYTTHAYRDSSEVIKDLRNYIASYEKTQDVSGVLSDKTEIAYQNALKLERYFQKNGYNWPSNECNPRTDIPVIIDAIRVFEQNGKQK